MNITHKLMMDLETKEPTRWIEIPRGDVNTRRIRLLLTENQQPWAVPEGATVLIRYKKPDGTEGEYDTLPDGTVAWEAVNNMLTIIVAPQVLTMVGPVMLYASIRLEEKVLNTFAVEIRVCGLDDGGGVERIDKSEDYFYMTRALPGPDFACVGQLLCVDAVDAKGRVTRVRTVEFSVPKGDAPDIPAYWQEAVEEGAGEINGALLAAGANKSAFLFYTDAHWNYNSKRSPELLKYLYRHTGMNKTFFGGDIVLNESADADAMAYLWEWRSMLKNLPNHHSVVGNHDDGNTTNNLFSEAYVYGYLLAAEETPDIVRGDSGLYYYIDSPAEKTRYLFLDTAFQTVLYDAQQLAFIVDALERTPTGWHIAAIAHIWYNTDYEAEPPTVGALSYAGEMLLKLFDDYNARATGEIYVQASSTDTATTEVCYDFTDCGGKVEFCIGGHTHWDYDGASEGGIPVILCETDSTLVRSGLDATAGTVNEASVSGIIADYDAGKITVVRVGRGVSRVVSGAEDTPEEPETPVSYTNVLEEVGYKDNTRWSTSSNAETTATGWDLTGYIPVAKGDILRLKNITWYPTAENSGRGGAVWFDSNKTMLNNSNFTSEDNVSAWAPVYDDAGNIIQLTVPATSPTGTAYLRLCCQDLNENSIITVNEEIA